MSKKSQSNEEQDKLTVEQFVLRAIEKLAEDGRPTIHTVFSGFNSAFRDYFKGEGLDPIDEVQKLKEAGTIDFRFARGGAAIGKPGSIAKKMDATDALKKMGIG